ncbi:MAG TPA: hypothetical protein VMZ26_06850 [Pyrinomonadaceae bacterium]|nr:hypothetical protein [Pyrinomonadaceae bacterium]
MKLVLNLVFFVALSVVTNEFAAAQGPGQRNAPATTDLATLFARDPLTQSLCFKDGGPGGVFQNGQTRNRCSDLNFNSYSADAFKVGVEGGREGVILDLGTPEELMKKYGYTETVGQGQGFASIDVKNGKALILKDYRTGKLQDLSESAALFHVADKTSSAAVRLGHVYLVRITDKNDKGFEMFAKFLVVAHVPNESATIRWQVIADNESAKL